MADETPTLRPLLIFGSKGAVFTHGHLTNTPSGAPYPLALAHDDWAALEAALDREGICGDEAPNLFVNCAETMHAVCELRHGHASEWHEDGTGKRWRLTRGRSVEKALDDAVAHLADEEALGLELAAEVAALRSRLTEVERQRDEAIAHDRQPYPTADAFEAACHALRKYRDLADRATAALQRSSLAVEEAEGLRREFERRIASRPETASLANRLTAVEAERDRMLPVVEAALAMAKKYRLRVITRIGVSQPEQDLLAAVDLYSSTVHPPTPETPNGH